MKIKKKNGFTLVELLATFIILIAVNVIAFSTVGRILKDGKQGLYQAQLEEIEEATEKWAYLNLDLLPNDGNEITITILELKKAGLLPLDIRDPRDDELLPNDMQIVISSSNGVYSYNVNKESGSNITSQFNENSPILILNGSPLEYVEFGSVYTDKGARAKDKSGTEIIDIDIMYQYNGTEIGQLNTSEFKTYTIIYSAENTVKGMNYVSSITRTIVVRDTTAPELSVPEQVEITLNQASTFNLLEGATVTDNSGEAIAITTSGYEATVGRKIVSYTACDSRNNCITKKRIINITE